MFVVPAHLVWEIMQLPLYTIWADGSAREIAFAILHCTTGDLLIALLSLIAALILVGNGAWPERSFTRVAVLMVAFGVLYTIFIEWLNIVVREGWAYSELMPWYQLSVMVCRRSPSGLLYRLLDYGGPGGAAFPQTTNWGKPE